HDYLREWADKHRGYADIIVSMEQRSMDYASQSDGPPEPMCRWCKAREPTWKCEDCFGFPEGCQDCFSKAHNTLPFHNVLSWTGTHYEPSFLHKAGVVIHLGHGGTPCPTPHPPKDPPTASDQSSNPSFESERISFKVGLGKAFTRKHIDEERNSYLVVVDCNGLHQVAVDWCRCSPAVNRRYDIQLLQSGLYPSTPKSPRTAFTFRLLDSFLLMNRECKVPAMSYFSLLQRQTLSIAPQEVPARYVELQRCSRQWRFMKALIDNGHVAIGRKLGQGALATACPACPHPGINMADDWKDDPDWFKHAATLCVDGNFKADHLRMKKEENDVPLADGARYMTESSAYKVHLAASEPSSRREVSTCNAHRAVTQANQGRGLHKDVNGIAAVACARHGFFVPGTGVDIHLGERFCTIDWAIYMGSLWFLGLLHLLWLYDIWCIYNAKLKQRFSDSSTISFPPGLTIAGGIGQFHVHGHKGDCYARYSPLFILGAGWVDGEILETLWSMLNEISRSTRAMTTSHRKEVLDDHMDDSNWKKLIRIALSLASKWRKAVQEFVESQDVLADLSEVAGSERVQEWTAQLDQAYKDRADDVKSMDILTVHFPEVPSQAQIEEELTKNSPRASAVKGMTSAEWLSEGLNIGVQQYDVPILGVTQMAKSIYRLRVIELVKVSEGNDQVESAHKAREGRRALANRLKIWFAEAPIFVGSLVKLNLEEESPELRNEAPEHVVLPLPSAFGAAACEAHQLSKLMEQEAELRKGQMNDHLNEMKIGIARKALGWSRDVRAARGSVHQQTRARAKVHRMEEELRHHTRVYRSAREASISMGLLDEKYEELLEAHLNAKAVDLNPATRGIRNAHLPWIWRMHTEKQDTPEWMLTFARIQWMREKCRFDRWQEELLIVQEEMKRVKRYFDFQASDWETRSNTKDLPGGHVALANRKRGMWHALSRLADETFK
ncbi:hypothetical protein CONPUDRAFT_32522, partial [Coniophora puteana RWD-64-598 SS2]